MRDRYKFNLQREAKDHTSSTYIKRRKKEKKQVLKVNKKESNCVEKTLTAQIETTSEGVKTFIDTRRAN